jgi:hypothetical protein
MLWIDGIGAWQICAGQKFLIGGPTLEDVPADICLLASISRRHATLEKIQEDWFIHAHHSTVVSGRTVVDRALVKSGDQIQLGDRLRLGFRVPSMLSGTAVIDFESHHRPRRSVDGIILMTESCLLGPRNDHHIFCPDWPEHVVLFQQDGQLRIRSGMELMADGKALQNGEILTAGSTVSNSSSDLRFRIEKLTDR